MQKVLMSIMFITSASLFFSNMSFASSVDAARTTIYETQDYKIADSIRSHFNQTDNDADDHIDTDLDDCLSKHGDTPGMTGCLADAQKAYDQLLNHFYQTILKTSPAAIKQQIQEAQRKWLAYKQADQKAWDSAQAGGTIRGIIAGWHDIAITRMQIGELAYYVGGGQE